MSPAIDPASSAASQDILAAALKVCEALRLPRTPANIMPIAAAIQAERERAANIAPAIARIGMTLTKKEAELVELISRMILAGEDDL